MKYDIKPLLAKHKSCLEDISKDFGSFFAKADYSEKSLKQVKVHRVSDLKSLDGILKGPGFYLIASNIRTPINVCQLKIENLSVIYRGHSSNVKERLESHLFYNSYTKKNSGRKFTVCMKLNGENINLDQHSPRSHEWYVVTHSMPKSMKLIREAAEIAFDRTFGRPVCSAK